MRWNDRSTSVRVDSPDVRYTEEYIETEYAYRSCDVLQQAEETVLRPRTTRLQFRTLRRVPPRLGLLMVGWGGNNGSTLTGALLARRLGLTWSTREGPQGPTLYGSLTQAGTLRLGGESYAPFGAVLPLVDPDALVPGGWDISGLDLGAAMRRARVLDPELQRQLEPHVRAMRPMRAAHDPRFVAENQGDRADNLIPGTKWQQMEQIRQDIREFRRRHDLETAPVVVWTANTERFCEERDGLNDTADNLLAAIRNDSPEVSPSTLYAVASILEGCPYLNGSPQNTFVEGCVQLAERRGVPIGGDDLKSGQTKLKSVLVDFLIGAGLKPLSIVSYNHLGNNDGRNLSAPEQFRAKERSKSNVVDDMVASNPLLYAAGEKPDHCVVIKYVPSVGDSKRALDEYTSEIALGGRNTLVVHNTCEDSLLAAPLILDLALLAELCTRISYRPLGDERFRPLHPVLSALAYLCKAPRVPAGAPVVNALSRQRACIEQLFRACAGLPPLDPLAAEHLMAGDAALWKDGAKTRIHNGG